MDYHQFIKTGIQTAPSGRPFRLSKITTGERDYYGKFPYTVIFIYLDDKTFFGFKFDKKDIFVKKVIYDN